MEDFMEKQRELEARENALNERETALALGERELKRQKGRLEVQIEDLVQVKRERMRESEMEALKKEEWVQKASQSADLRAAMVTFAAQISKIEQLLQEVEDGLECCLCMERNACTAFVPCGHTFCGSAECGSSYVDECPTCRAKVTGRTKLFGVETQCEGISAAMAAVEKVAAAAAVKANEGGGGSGATSGAGKSEEVGVESAGGAGSRKRKAQEVEEMVAVLEGDKVGLVSTGSFCGEMACPKSHVRSVEFSAWQAMGPLKGHSRDNPECTCNHDWSGYEANPECPVTGHSDWVLSGVVARRQNVAWSPDGKTVASGSEDDTLRLWDVETGLVKCTLKGHDCPVLSVAFSPNGKSVASCSGDIYGHGGTNCVKIWNLDDMTEVCTLKGHSEDNPECTCWEEDGVFIFDEDCPVVDPRLKCTLKGHSMEVRSVAWSPDGKTVASGSEDKTIRLWDVETGSEKCSLTGHCELVYSVAWSPCGNFVASGSQDGTIKIWEVVTGSEKCSLTGHSDEVLSVAWSPCGNFVASGSLDRTVKIWHIQTGREKCSLKGHSKDNPECTCKHGEYWINYEANPECPVTGHSNGVSSVAWSPDGKLVASGSWDKTIRIWDVATGKEAMGPLKRHSGWVTSVA